MADVDKTREDLSDELDETLLAAIREMKKRVASGGEPSAALLNAATARLKALGYTRPANGASADKALAEELGLEDEGILKFPQISDEPDEATGT